MPRVYDDRTGETLFRGTNAECVCFILAHFDENDDDYEHIWIGEDEPKIPAQAELEHNSNPLFGLTGNKMIDSLLK